MPNKHAAKKDLRKNKRRAARNARMKSHVRHLLRNVNELTKEGKLSEAATAAKLFQQAAAKAAKKGVLSINSVRRKTGRVMRNALKKA